MDNDARIVKSILAVGVLNALAVKSEIGLGAANRQSALNTVAKVTEDLYLVLFPGRPHEGTLAQGTK